MRDLIWHSHFLRAFVPAEEGPGNQLGPVVSHVEEGGRGFFFNQVPPPSVRPSEWRGSVRNLDAQQALLFGTWLKIGYYVACLGFLA